MAVPVQAAEPGRSVARPVQPEPLAPAAWSGVVPLGEAPSSALAVELVPGAEPPVPAARTAARQTAPAVARWAASASVAERTGESVHSAVPGARPGQRKVAAAQAWVAAPRQMKAARRLVRPLE